MRRGCTVPNPLILPSTKNSDGTEKIAMTGSVDGCSVLSETKFFRNHLSVDTSLVLSLVDFLSPMGTARERPEFDINPPLGAVQVDLRTFTQKC